MGPWGYRRGETWGPPSGVAISPGSPIQAAKQGGGGWPTQKSQSWGGIHTVSGMQAYTSCALIGRAGLRLKAYPQLLHASCRSRRRALLQMLRPAGQRLLLQRALRWRSIQQPAGGRVARQQAWAARACRAGREQSGKKGGARAAAAGVATPEAALCSLCHCPLTLMAVPRSWIRSGRAAKGPCKARGLPQQRSLPSFGAGRQPSARGPAGGRGAAAAI